MPSQPAHKSQRAVVAAAAAAGALLLAGLALIIVSGGWPARPARSAAVPQPAARPESTLSSATSGAVIALVERTRARSTPVTGSASATETVVVTATITARPKPAPAVVAPVRSKVDAYKGLGSWVDLYDDAAWKDPAAAIRDMKRHGVRTLYLETGNSPWPTALKDAAAIGAFIREAHTHGIAVVAWYRPDLTNPALDFDRIAAALRFRTSDGQRFDSFALDIETTVVVSVKARNRALLDLSRKIRARQGANYPLGAITPSPVGIATNAGYWPGFPYGELAGIYDVFVPMSYYTYHGKGEAAAFADTAANIRILRAQKGMAKMPIHLIGGISDDSTSREVGAFVRVVNRSKLLGASLYGWAGTTDAHWAELRLYRP